MGKAFRICSVVMALLAGIVWVSEGRAGEQRISIGGGTIGGSLYIITTGMAKVISQHVPGVSAAGQASDINANIGHVQKKDMEIGGTQPQGMRWAWDGVKYMQHFGKTRDVRLFLPGPTWAIYFLVLPDSPVKQIADIKGKRISMGGALSSSEVIEELLKQYGLTLEKDYQGKRMGHQSAVEALKDGTLDVAIPFGAVPSPAAMDAMTTKKARLIPVEMEQIKKLSADSPYWFPLTLKKGVLPNMDRDVLTLGGFDIFVTHKDLSEELVYKMTKALVEHAGEVEKVHPGGAAFRLEYIKDMIQEKRFQAGGTPIHPGVLRYLAERGVRP